jgi:hypothetical protein
MEYYPKTSHGVDDIKIPYSVDKQVQQADFK